MDSNCYKSQQNECQSTKKYSSYFLRNGSNLSTLFASLNKQKCSIKANSKIWLNNPRILFPFLISLIVFIFSDGIIEWFPYILIQILVTNRSINASLFWKKFLIIILDLSFTIILSINERIFILLIINHLSFLMSFYESYLRFQRHLKFIFFEIIVAFSLKGLLVNFYFIPYFIKVCTILIIFYIIATFAIINIIYYFQMHLPQNHIITFLNKISFSFFVSDSQFRICFGNIKWYSMLEKIIHIPSNQKIYLEKFFEEDVLIPFNTLKYIFLNKKKKSKIKGLIMNNLLKQKSSYPIFLKMKIFSKINENLIGLMKLESKRNKQNKFNSKINEQILAILNKLVEIPNNFFFNFNISGKQYDAELLILRLNFQLYFLDQKKAFINNTFNLITLVLEIINLYIKGSNGLPLIFSYKNRLKFSGKVSANIDIISSLFISILDMITVLCQTGNIIQIDSYLHESLPNDFIILFTFNFDLKATEFYPFLNKYFKNTFDYKNIAKNLEDIPSQYYNKLFRFLSIKSLVLAQSNTVFVVGPLSESQVSLSVYFPMSRDIDEKFETQFNAFMEIDPILFDSCIWDDKNNYEVKYRNSFDLINSKSNNLNLMSEFCQDFQVRKRSIENSIPRDINLREKKKHRLTTFDCNTKKNNSILNLFKEEAKNDGIKSHKKSNNGLDKFNQNAFQVSDSVFKSIVKRRPLKNILIAEEMKNSDQKDSNQHIFNSGNKFHEKRDIRASDVFPLKKFFQSDESEIHFKLSDEQKRINFDKWSFQFQYSDNIKTASKSKQFSSPTSQQKCFNYNDKKNIGKMEKRELSQIKNMIADKKRQLPWNMIALKTFVQENNTFNLSEAKMNTEFFQFHPLIQSLEFKSLDFKMDKKLRQVLLVAISEPSLTMIKKSFVKRSINCEISENGINALKRILKASQNQLFYNVIIIEKCNFFTDISDLAAEIRKLENSYFKRKSIICGLIENISKNLITKCRNYDVNIIMKTPLDKFDLKKLLHIFEEFK